MTEFGCAHAVDRGARRALRRAIPGIIVLMWVLTHAALAVANPLLSVSTSLQSPTTVGQGGNGALSATNQSTAPHNVPMTLSDIKLTLSCGTTVPVQPCQQPDPGVFQIAGTPVGRAGTACAGIVFSVSAADGVGGLRLTPSNTVTLQASGSFATCSIDFSFTTQRAPNIDLSPSPGVQTAVLGFVAGNSTFDQMQATAQGSSLVTVMRASPTISNSATSANYGQSITDQASLSGGVAPIGTITFQLWGPSDPTCSGPPIFTSTIPIQNSSAGSGSFTPTLAGTPAGTYRWRATYSGDQNNNGMTSACGAPNANSVVSPAPTSTTVTAAGGTVGQQIAASAALTGGINATGTVTFSLFGPGNDTCAGPPIASSTVQLSNNAAQSSPHPTTGAGTYRWTASYSGDINNAASSSACGAAGSLAVVTPAQAVLAATATSTSLGGAITLDATLTSGVGPDGVLTFRAFGPSDPLCVAAPVFTSTPQVSGNGTYASGQFTPASAGTYQWVASYAGDPDNSAPSTACGDVTSTVSAIAPSATTDTAASLTARGARVRGDVNPHGSPTTYVFEYGRSTSYGASTAVRSAADGTSSLAVSVALSGLRVATTYHYRIVATNAAGSTVGLDRTFRTLRAAPSGVSLAASPGRDATVPYRFVASGRVALPADVSASRGCLGSVLVTVRRSSTLLLSRLVPLSATCTYAAPLPLPNLRGSGTLAVTAAFRGNAALLPRTAPARTVQFG